MEIAIDFYLIESLEHSSDGVKSWWKPGAMGYTRDITSAGKFTKERAEEIIRKANAVAEAQRCWREDEVLNEKAGTLEVIVLVPQFEEMKVGEDVEK